MTMPMIASAISFTLLTYNIHKQCELLKFYF
jgi:hypothetical protein